MKSHITTEELEAINSSGINFTYAPSIIRGVCASQFSIARHYGGCHAYGKSYAYIPTTDELIRDDVVRLLAKIRKGAEKVKREAAKSAQGVLF